MPSRLGKRKDYSPVDDAYDSRIPVHNEDAFRHGITFKAKYIGTLDVPRPTGRMEIVVAMRRIRYEFKAKAVKKRKVNIRVSTDGVRVVLRKKKKKKEWAWDLDRMLIMQDPIYRIFYVSHDSHDLKIWSYIARDGASNVFRCNVFKSPKKSLAMHIVRTIGQAFEVCHKLNIGPPTKKDDSNSNGKIKTADDKTSEETDPSKQDKLQELTPTDSIPSNGDLEVKKSFSLDGKPPIGTKDTSILQSASEPISIQAIDSKTPLSAHHQLQLSQQKILQAEQQTEVAIAQVHLLKDQLAAEGTARIEAQARNHQLLLQNRDLLQQMTELVARLAEVEAKLNNTDSEQQSSLQLSKIVIDATTPASAMVQDPSLSGAELTKISPFVDTSLYENTNTNTPEMSKYSNGLLATADTSTSTITKSSMGSGSVRAKRRSNESGSSSESSSDGEEAISGPIRLASERGTLKNTAVDKTALSPTNGTAIVDRTGNTSIWTSGLATPERILSGQSYQQSTVSFNDMSLTTTANDSNLSNGYMLSPIFTLGANSDSQSGFQHFSITEADVSLKIEDTPKGAMKKSFSTSANMHGKEKSATATFHSIEELPTQSKASSFLRWTQMSEKSPLEDSFHSQLNDASQNSSDAIMTPRLNPPPLRVKRVPSSRAYPEYRPRPETQPSDLAISPSHPPTVISKGIGSPQLVDTSDSDLEIPPKLAKYNQGVKLSQSTYACGSDPLLSRFDPLLFSKSKSFDHNSPTIAQKETENPPTTVLSPVQDVGQSNPFLYITPRTPESSKYCKPVNPNDLSRSYDDLDQSVPLCVSGVFQSPEEYETRLRYEPLKKQQASEWHRSSNTTETRLNSSFHAGDKIKESNRKAEPCATLKESLPAYRTYIDLPSTITPQKTTVHPSTHEKFLHEAMVHSIASLNTNNNNSNQVSSHLANIEDSSFKDGFKEPPSVDGNISLLDDLCISEPEDRVTPNPIGKVQPLSHSLSFKDGNCQSGEQHFVPSTDCIGKNDAAGNDQFALVHESKTLNAVESSGNVFRAETSSGGNEVSTIPVIGKGEMSPASDTNPISGSNSDSGVSGCSGSKHEQDSSNVATVFSCITDQ